MFQIGDLFYHGSYVKVEEIDLSKGMLEKDFGQGFYTTSSKKQAEKFAQIKAKRYNKTTGFVSIFEWQVLDASKDNLKIKNFPQADDEWLDFVLFNRKYASADKVHQENYDVIAGPVANDAVGIVLNQLFLGTYGNPRSAEARETALRLLET
jgi:hypothetical protein